MLSRVESLCRGSYFLSAVPGAACLRCSSAVTAAGRTLAMAACSLFCQPDTTSRSPFIMASNPTLATSAGSSFCRADLGVEHVGAFEEIGLGGARHQAGDG